MPQVFSAAYTAMDLEAIRKEINETDTEILQAFTKRMALCGQVAAYKQAHDLPVYQADREQAVIARMQAASQPALADGTAALFSCIMDISKCLQQRALSHPAPIPAPLPIPSREHARIGCQGTSGSNSETAATQLFPDLAPRFYAEFEDVFRAVETGEIDYGILPIQNSTAGTVARTYELLRRYPMYITETTTVEIEHCLAARPGLDETAIRTVCSHPQALRQCGRFLRQTGWEQLAYSNTATAAQYVSETDKPIAAVCSPACAARYGLRILRRDIADCIPNLTQFLCIAKTFQVHPDADTVSVIVSLPHTQGSLCRMLTKFYANGLDLLRLESRPIADGSFDVIFYLDFRGNVQDPTVRAILTELSESLSYFRFLGNHKEHKPIVTI